jgi:copper chaperone
MHLHLELRRAKMVKLKVPDMSCDHCVRTIEKAVKGVDPTAAVTVDLAATLVTVATTVASREISEAIRAAGYENTAGAA